MIWSNAENRDFSSKNLSLPIAPFTVTNIVQGMDLKHSSSQDVLARTPNYFWTFPRARRVSGSYDHARSEGKMDDWVDDWI